jgi:hypothetical protein
VANLQNAPRRIIGVRTSPAGPLLFCEAGKLSPATGEWVMVEINGEVFPAQVALPDHLVETMELEGALPVVSRAANETELAATGIRQAVEAEIVRKFEELSAAHRLPYLLKEVEARSDRLIVRFSAMREPDSPQYVSLLEALAGISKTRIELFLVSEDFSPARPPSGEKFAGWVNGLLKEPDPAVMAKAIVGEPLLDESEVYRPGQRPAERPAQQVPPSEAEEAPAAVYDPATGKTRLGGVDLEPFDRGDH